MIFAFWAAEEEGLLGSRYYVRNLDFPAGKHEAEYEF